MTLIDTNVIIDIIDRDPFWFDWSTSHLAAAGGDGAMINSIVVAELSRNYGSFADLEAEMQDLSIEVVALDEASAFVGGKRFQVYRSSREASGHARVLPDFLIGGHALTLNAPLLTRDPRLYRRYFPELTLITPETHP